MSGTKQPVSVLVVIHTPALEVLMLERVNHAGFWQSVTGSREGDESLIETARREVFEETGIACTPEAFVDWRLSNTYDIFPVWRHRYPDGITRNTEHLFSLMLPATCAVTPSAQEHRAHGWLPLDEAAKRCFSWSNRDAILMIGQHRCTRPG